MTNHAVVAMVGSEVKQTRCTTCDAEHEYKHARVPRQRRKDTPAALYSQVVANGPKKVAHEPPDSHEREAEPPVEAPIAAAPGQPEPPAVEEPVDVDDDRAANEVEEGPVHRPLIRATLPRPEGQPPPTRPAPEFTIRQPGGRQNRFRHRHGRGGQQFHGNRSNGGMPGGMPRHGGGRPPIGRHHAQGRKRQK